MDVSNDNRQEWILNAKNKAQLTHAKIKWFFKIIVIASNESSSSTKVIKLPHNKEYPIFTHNDTQFNV